MKRSPGSLAVPRALRAVAGLRRVSAMALYTYRPSPAFAGFCASSDRFLLARAANRTGKTQHSMYKVARTAIEKPGSRGRVTGPTGPQVHQVSGRYLAEFLDGHLHPRSYYTLGKGWNTATIGLRNGSTIQLRSYQDHPQAHAGDDLDYVALDEVPTRGIYMESLARVFSRSGQLWVTMTAVDRPIGWYRAQVEPEGSTPTARGDGGVCREGSPWVQYVAELTKQACPWYSEEQISDFRELIEAGGWQYAQRVKGAWEGAASGVRFPAWSTLCVVDAHELPGEVDLYRVGLDHGSGTGKQRATLTYVSLRGPQPVYWIAREKRWPANSTSGDVADGLIEMLEFAGFNRQSAHQIETFGDLNLAGRDSGGVKFNLLVQRALARRGWQLTIRPPMKRRGSRVAGESALNAAMKEGRWLVERSCRGFIDSAPYYTGLGTRMDEGLKDPIDSARYSVLDLLLESRVARAYSLTG